MFDNKLVHVPTRILMIIFYCENMSGEHDNVRH